MKNNRKAERGGRRHGRADRKKRTPKMKYYDTYQLLGEIKRLEMELERLECNRLHRELIEEMKRMRIENQGREKKESE